MWWACEGKQKEWKIVFNEIKEIIEIEKLRCPRNWKNNDQFNIEDWYSEMGNFGY